MPTPTRVSGLQALWLHRIHHNPPASWICCSSGGQASMLSTERCSNLHSWNISCRPVSLVKVADTRRQQASLRRSRRSETPSSRRRRIPNRPRSMGDSLRPATTAAAAPSRRSAVPRHSSPMPSSPTPPGNYIAFCNEAGKQGARFQAMKSGAHRPHCFPTHQRSGDLSFSSGFGRFP